MEKLLKGELTLTIDILLGLLLGEVIIRLKLPDLLLRRFTPFLQRHGVNSTTGLAVATSIGSSKAGAAILSSALTSGQISERCAVWSVLMLSLPSYLKRWPSTLLMSVSMAGRAGMFYALSMLFVAVSRFVIAFTFLKRGNDGEAMSSEPQAPSVKTHSMSLVKKLVKTLPLAWIFFALAYSLVPVVNSYLQEVFRSPGVLGFLPLSGWAVAAGAVVKVSAALAMAGGAMASGELSTAGAVFALVLGSGLGTATRIIRMNAGYYFGFFPAKTAQKMLIMNFITIMPAVILNWIFALFALLF